MLHCGDAIQGGDDLAAIEGLSPREVNQAAETLLAARKAGEVVQGLPARLTPKTLEDAYRVQERLYNLMGRPCRGWFVGCSNPVIQDQLGLSGPYRAPLLADTIFESPARLSAARYPGLTLELEFAFRLGRDLTPRAEPYAREEVAEAVESLHPSIEVVMSHLADWTRQPIFSLIADNGTDGALVVGSGRRDWRDLDLVAMTVELVVADKVERRGSGADVLGDPLAALVWLANDCARNGITLEAGHLHNTGSCTAMYHPAAGDQVRACFNGLGEVGLSILP